MPPFLPGGVEASPLSVPDRLPLAELDIEGATSSTFTSSEGVPPIAWLGVWGTKVDASEELSGPIPSEDLFLTAGPWTCAEGCGKPADKVRPGGLLVEGLPDVDSDMLPGAVEALPEREDALTRLVDSGFIMARGSTFAAAVAGMVLLALLPEYCSTWSDSSAMGAVARALPGMWCEDLIADVG